MSKSQMRCYAPVILTLQRLRQGDAWRFIPQLVSHCIGKATFRERLFEKVRYRALRVATPNSSL